MPKRSGQSPYDLEPQLLPEFDGTGVGTDHEIELHGFETRLARFLQAMPAECRACRCRGHRG